MELLFPHSFLGLPLSGNFFYFLYFFLFQMRQKLSHFSTFPHLELPHNLILNGVLGLTVHGGWS